MLSSGVVEHTVGVHLSTFLGTQKGFPEGQAGNGYKHLQQAHTSPLSPIAHDCPDPPTSEKRGLVGLFISKGYLLARPYPSLLPEIPGLFLFYPSKEWTP